ncbi:MAG: sterol desaturase family protein [Gammaproteobacteria bacterium]|nr:sterol desaturase family protein [Gammaproteobacteria bacterium]
MENFAPYFAEMPTTHKLLWLFACLGTATLAERLIPLRRHGYNWWRHFRTNAALLTSTMVINALFTALVLMASAIASSNNFGLLAWLDWPYWAEFLLALAIMDLFAQYTIHYLLHKVPLLWRFHKVHHSDTHVDATTGTRHHPVDYLTREVFSLTMVVLLGMPPEFYAMYRVITIFCTYFTHANIQLPSALDRALSFVIVTPDAHKFHHHDEVPWTDRNYGNIFVFWDRLFGTFVYQSTDRIVFGVDTMDDSKSDDLGHQLVVPFQTPQLSAARKATA